MSTSRMTLSRRSNTFSFVYSGVSRLMSLIMLASEDDADGVGRMLCFELAFEAGGDIASTSHTRSLAA